MPFVQRLGLSLTNSQKVSTLWASETTRLTFFDPPQSDRFDGGKGEHILVGRRTLGSLPSDEDAGDLCREGERRAHDGR